MTTVARLIGRRLREAGVRYVMGHPGGEVIDLIEGFRQEGLEFVLTKHEASAGFMAEAIGTFTGIPGVCVGTLGPGATNLVTGVAQAFLDRAPVIAISGQLPADRYETVTHQRLDLGAIFAPITKFHARVTAVNAETVVARALRLSTRGRRGPVYLEVPSDVPQQDARGLKTDPRHVRTAMTFGPTDAVEAAALLASSRHPLILAGMDANRSDVAPILRAVAERWVIPVMVGPKAKGAFPEDHPLFLGTIEMFQTQDLYSYIDRCDVVLMVGFDSVEFDRDWRAPSQVIHVGPLPNDDLYYRADAEMVGPVRAALEALLLAHKPFPKHDLATVHDVREAFLARVEPHVTGMSPQYVLKELRRALPRSAIVTCDVGFNKAVTGQCWPTYEPQTFFMSNGLSSMGYGLPAAIGLQLAAPDRRVACVLGDGGFAMVMGELETAVRRELPLLIVILVDDALSQIKVGQERRNVPATGTTFGRLDYVALADAFGARGRVAMTPAECADAFDEPPDGHRPTLVAAVIDPGAYRI